MTLEYIDGREAGASSMKRTMGSQEPFNVSSAPLSVESAALHMLLQDRGHNVSLAAVYGTGSSGSCSPPACDYGEIEALAGAQQVPLLQAAPAWPWRPCWLGAHC